MFITPASAGGIAVGLFGSPFIARYMQWMPQHRNFLFGLMIFSTCHIKKPFYQEVFFVLYRGVDRGFGVTVPDVLFIGFFMFILFGKHEKRIILWPYNSFPWVLVIFISMFSLLGSPVAYYGLFTVHKFVKGLILYWVMVNWVRSREDILVVIKAFICTMIFQGGVVLFSKYVTKAVVNRSIGSFPHPNTLAMYLDLISPLILSMLLSASLPKKWNKWAILAIALSITSILFTKSRGAWVIMAGAYLVVMGLSLLVA